MRCCVVREWDIYVVVPQSHSPSTLWVPSYQHQQPLLACQHCFLSAVSVAEVAARPASCNVMTPHRPHSKTTVQTNTGPQRQLQQEGLRGLQCQMIAAGPGYQVRAQSRRAAIAPRHQAGKLQLEKLQNLSEASFSGYHISIGLRPPSLLDSQNIFAPQS